MGNEPARVNNEQTDDNQYDTVSHNSDNPFKDEYVIGGFVAVGLFLLLIISIILWCCCRVFDKFKTKIQDLNNMENQIKIDENQQIAANEEEEVEMDQTNTTQ